MSIYRTCVSLYFSIFPIFFRSLNSKHKKKLLDQSNAVVWYNLDVPLPPRLSRTFVLVSTTKCVFTSYVSWILIDLVPVVQFVYNLIHFVVSVVSKSTLAHANVRYNSHRQANALCGRQNSIQFPVLRRSSMTPRPGLHVTSIMRKRRTSPRFGAEGLV